MTLHSCTAEDPDCTQPSVDVSPHTTASGHSLSDDGLHRAARSFDAPPELNSSQYTWIILLPHVSQDIAVVGAVSSRPLQYVFDFEDVPGEILVVDDAGTVHLTSDFDELLASDDASIESIISGTLTVYDDHDECRLEAGTEAGPCSVTASIKLFLVPFSNCPSTVVVESNTAIPVLWELPMVPMNPSTGEPLELESDLRSGDAFLPGISKVQYYVSRVHSSQLPSSLLICGFQVCVVSP